jgi:hypothetical protein
MTSPGWPTCKALGDSCPGIQVEGFGRCLAHLIDKEFDEFLSRLRPGSDLDARGTTITPDLLGMLTSVSIDLGVVDLRYARFEKVDRFGPWTVRRLILDASSFDRHVLIEVDTNGISCVRTRFDGGMTLRVSGATIDATEIILGATSSISTSLAFPGRLSSSPKVVSLRGADVGDLVLIDVDLSECLFVGAHRLDQLRLEDRSRFAGPPSGRRLARRQMLFEEFLARGWATRHDHLADALPIRWERIAALYRSLRKAFEDGKNEAGAGDFYYGEMEARRHSEVTPLAERWTLAAYWALSGYGQRAVRAVLAIIVLVAAVSTLLFTVGLSGDHVWSWGRVDQSVRIALGAVVFRDAGQTLTSAGAWTVMIARFVGPVLLALGVLAVRARVKR